METSHITDLLAQFDAEQWQPYFQAKRLEFRGGGGCGAWNCKTENGVLYVVKSQNNPQDRPYGLPWKILTTELICGRLGQLFDPIICPPVSVINIPDELVAGNNILYNGSEQVVVGPSFGSQLVDGMIETKAGGRIELVPFAQIARIIVFQTWLRGEDVAALVALDGSKSLSIDHGWYLTGSRWDTSVIANPFSVLPVQIPQFQQQGELIEAQHYLNVLDELDALSEIDIVRAFSAVPTEWGASLAFRTELASFVLKRRDLVKQAVSTIWKGATVC